MLRDIARLSIRRWGGKRKETLPGLLIVKWHLPQDGRFDQAFGFFAVFIRINQLATGIHQASGHEDDQVPFDILFLPSARVIRFPPKTLIPFGRLGLRRQK
jgi:hypothetical protein